MLYNSSGVSRIVASMRACFAEISFTHLHPWGVKFDEISLDLVSMEGPMKKNLFLIYLVAGQHTFFS